MRPMKPANPCRSVLIAATILLSLCTSIQADEIELLTGGKFEGKIVARDEQSLTVQVTVSGRAFTRKLPLDRVLAITTDGKREVLQAGSAAEKPAASIPALKPGTRVQRTQAEIEQIIKQVGPSEPDWWKSTPLDYPKTLDLSYPAQAPGQWNNQKNIGQYIWDVINPNQGKWRSGVRFMHHLLEVHKDNPETRRRVMNNLGGMYYRLLEDYPRAAYWWRAAGVDKDDRFWTGLDLAECYWKLGNKQMAMELLKRVDPQWGTIKLLADMGDTKQALQLAESWGRGSSAADVAYLYAGDACRVAGMHNQALQYYQKVLAVRAEGKAKGRVERNHRRAQANIEGIKVFDSLDLRRVPDGVYQSNSMGYEAPVNVEVTVKAGRIEDVKVTSHREKQYYSSISETCRKIVQRQSVAEIDATTGATITSEAIINATAKALAGAMK